MPVHNIMGYFSNYIIENKKRIIFIGNEKEIKDNEGNADEKYIRTKEKIIGETYTLQPEIDSAITLFISNIINKNGEIYISKEKYIETCKTVVDRLKIFNLRAIWQSLFKVQRLLNAVIETKAYNEINYDKNEYGENDKTKEDYLAYILEIYLVLYLQIYNSDVKKESFELNGEKDKYKNIEEIIGVYKNKKCSLKKIEEIEDKQEQNNNNQDWEKSTIRTPSEFIALCSLYEYSYKIWSDYLLESKIDNAFLEKVVEENQDWFVPHKDKQSTIFILLSEKLNMDNNEFHLNYEKMKKEFMQGKYKKLGELIHGYSLCLSFEKYGVIKYENNEIRDFFDEVLKRTEIEIESNRCGSLLYDCSSMGYEFGKNMTNNEGKLFIEKLSDLDKEKKNQLLKRRFIEEFNNISNEKEFSYWMELLSVYNSNRDYQPYSKQAVLCWIEYEKLFDELVDKRYEIQFIFVEVLKRRYMYAKDSTEKFYLDELVVLKNIKQLYETRIKNNGIGNIENYRLNLIEDKLATLIKRIKS